MALPLRLGASGMGGGAAMALCGLVSLGGTPEKGQPGYRLFMIVVHVGLLLVALFAVVFGIQFARSLGKNPRQTKLFAVLEAGTLVALIALVKAKPKKKKTKDQD
mmetsp:Transcript_1035/g.3531  ORF Transcript_1035/g.3531 Transcript_1035/m.3531 type:complete len:105 (+) Transcript_1035:171-485(+)